MISLLLHLLRHGEPSTPGLLMGHTDGEPTPAGIAACVDQVADLDITDVISSDLKRCARVAHAVGRQRGIPISVDPRWRELNFGAWDGLAASAVDPDASRRFWDDPDVNPPPSGERWSSLIARISSAIGDITGLSTLVVTHGGAIRGALACLCGFDKRQIWAVDLPYGALLTLRVWPADKPTAQIIGLWP